MTASSGSPATSATRPRSTRTFTRVEQELGTISVLVLNAGIFPIVPFVETTLEVWERTLAINLTGAFLCARRAIPGMREQRYGRIVAIGSSAGKSGGAKSVAAYAASKAGIMAMAKSIANEFAREGITANALAPSLIDTPMIAEPARAHRAHPGRALRQARGGRRARLLPRVGGCRLHHRRGDRHQRRLPDRLMSFGDPALVQTAQRTAAREVRLERMLPGEVRDAIAEAPIAWLPARRGRVPRRAPAVRHGRVLGAAGRGARRTSRRAASSCPGRT